MCVYPYIFYIIILLYDKCWLLQVLTAVLQKEMYVFWNYETVLPDLVLTFTHFVIICALLMIADQKLHWVKVKIVITTIILQCQYLSRDYLVKNIMISASVSQSLHVWSAFEKTSKYQVTCRVFSIKAYGHTAQNYVDRDEQDWLTSWSNVDSFSDCFPTFRRVNYNKKLGKTKISVSSADVERRRHRKEQWWPKACHGRSCCHWPL